MPTGMSFCGLRASCAATDTASNPIYAKKITPAPRSTPLQPYSPNEPAFGGINGCQFAELTYAAPPRMTMITTPTLTMTIAVLTLADSLMPITIRMVTAAVIITAGRLMIASGLQPAMLMTVQGAAASDGGKLMPTKSCRKLVRCPDQPTATVAAPSAYSRMRSQPIIHAMNSPSVAYPYVYAEPAMGTVEANSE